MFCTECRVVAQESLPAGVGAERVSRDMETETEVELLELELAGSRGSSARSSPSAPGSDLSASTDNIEELHQDAPFAGQSAHVELTRPRGVFTGREVFWGHWQRCKFACACGCLERYRAVKQKFQRKPLMLNNQFKFF